MSKNKHYVNNKEFHDELIKRKQLVDSAMEANLPIPQISDKLGAIFLSMAINITYKYNFNRYPFKEDMVGDGIIDCIKYVDTFDINRSNPFSYFTQAICNAFIRRIIRERKQMYIKSKILSNNELDICELQNHDEDGEFTNAFKEYMAAYNNFDGSMFEKKKSNRKYVPKSTLEDFYNE